MRHFAFALGLVLCLTGTGLRSSLAEGIHLSTGTPLALQRAGLVQELNRDYYLGALYLARGDDILAQVGDDTAAKRMSLKILAERISARAFQRYWKERIALNNPRAVWLKQSATVVQFTALFQTPLAAGERLDFDYLPGQGMEVWRNGRRLGLVPGASFYPLLLSAWLGELPPSAAFKNQLLGLGHAELTARFEALSTPQAPVIAAAPPAPVEVPEPAKPEAPAKAAAPAPKPAAPKPQAVAATPARPKPVPKPEPKPTLAPAPEPVAPAVSTAEAEQDQDLLVGAYKRDMLQHIRKHLRYPPRAWRLGLSGSGLIALNIRPDGGVENVEVLQSSGQMILDAAMKSMVEASLPLPTPPRGGNGETLRLEVPVDFVR